MIRDNLMCLNFKLQRKGDWLMRFQLNGEDTFNTMQWFMKRFMEPRKVMVR